MAGDRAAVLTGLGADAEAAARLLPLTGPLLPPDASLSGIRADEAHVESWLGYAEEAARHGALPVLRTRLVQLAFPVAPGISATDGYRRATLRGEWPEAGAPGLELDDPEGLEIRILDTLAGRLPALVARTRDDFESLVRAFSARNEPVAIPASMGACLIRGLTNWDRLTAYRSSWARDQPLLLPGAWARELEDLRARRKHLYQDRFLVLSSGPYSGVSAAEAGDASPDRWATISLSIRSEHEGAHYLALRAGGTLRDAPGDELLADWLGLVRTFGRYPADLARRFLGLEGDDRYRPGGRLENYLGEEGLPQSAFVVLCRLLDAAIDSLECLSLPSDDEALAELFLALSSVGLEELADADGVRVVSEIGAEGGTG